MKPKWRELKAWGDNGHMLITYHMKMMFFNASLFHVYFFYCTKKKKKKMIALNQKLLPRPLAASYSGSHGGYSLSLSCSVPLALNVRAEMLWYSYKKNLAELCLDLKSIWTTVRWWCACTRVCGCVCESVSESVYEVCVCFVSVHLQTHYLA